MKYGFIFLFWISLLVKTSGAALSCPAGFQEYNCPENDSTAICAIVNDFYQWYIQSIKHRQFNAYQPIFAQDSSGMTTLDGRIYFDNLKQHHFSSNLIKREMDSYQTCKDHLSKVKYIDFQTTSFLDLDDYERTECDFSNVFRWAGGQEICDGIQIESVRISGTETGTALIKKYNFSEKTGMTYDWSYLLCVTLIKEGDSWKIVWIEICYN